MGFTYKRPTGRQQGWKRRTFVGSKRAYPSPRCSKSISSFADKMVRESGLEEFTGDSGGAQFDANKIVCQLIDSLKLPIRPDHVHIQILGDGFRAMHSNDIVNVGVRVLVETEEEAGNTSFTALATL
jgi:hypothetical protein